MDASTLSYDRFIKRYDRKLFAVKTNQGMVQIWREGERPDDAMIPVEGDHVVRPNPQFIIALTDNWKLDGTPVEWGKEPLGNMIRSMDAWNKEDIFSSMLKNRDKEEEIKVKDRRNMFADIASETRREFAKSTNDIIVQK